MSSVLEQMDLAGGGKSREYLETDWKIVDVANPCKADVEKL